MTADVREVIAELERQGWKFTRTSKGHLRGTHRRARGKVLIVSGTSSDWRAGHNVRAAARRLVG